MPILRVHGTAAAPPRYRLSDPVPPLHAMNDANGPVSEQPDRALAFEALLWGLFLRLMDVPGDRVEAEILDAQRRLCRALDLDRSALWQTRSDDSRRLRVTHFYDVGHDGEAEASVDGSVAREQGPAFLLSGGSSIPKHADASDYFPWVVARVLAGVTTAIPAIDVLPAEAAADAETFRRFGTMSTVIVPLKAHGEILGCLTFATTRQARKWPHSLVAKFDRVAQVFAKALARGKTERQLQTALDDIKRLRDQLQHDNVYLQDEIRQRRNPSQIVGTSAAIRRTLDLVSQVAPTAATVLLLGETGTGKERVAAAIHELSPHRSRPMVKVNCAAIPTTLIESELFGREKGAYTGALTRQIGRFELANGSTIFLDEIGDLPVETQIKLLRVIETREFERLGSPNPIHVDVRIIAATNKDLNQAIREGHFREDLFFRLNVFPIALPALRERPEDIPLLATAIVDELGASMDRQFDAISRSSLMALQQYHWPGNIRELRNLVERAMITTDGPVLNIELPSAPARRPVSAPLSLKALEREHVFAVLQQTGWRIRGPRGAATVLGLPPTTLENRMKRLGIVRPAQKLP
jgi:transcriptional regulator with GAF, ATPase, and Fis domain